MKTYKHIYIGLLAICTLCFSCQEKEWDNYYGSSNTSTDVTLMQAIDANSNLSNFAAVIRQNGLEPLLASSQSLTVFAPDNDAMASMGTNGDLLQQFLYNHICRYTYTQGDVAEADDGLLRIKMLNGKYQTLTVDGGQLRFGDIATVTGTCGTANGVLNTISNIVPFYSNIYEQIKAQGHSTDTIAAYLKGYDLQTFLPDKSTVLGTNEHGETVYDSVFSFRNDWMIHYGHINLEDSVYTMLVPSNTAWEKQYEKLKTYFRAYGAGEIRNPASGLNITGTFAIADTTANMLTRAHSIEALTQDLVFRKSVDVENVPGDSLISTNGNVFYQPARLFAGATKQGVSNGQMYITDELLFDPVESWHKEIRVEAEQSSSYATQYAGSTSTGSVINYPQFSGKVSENGFLVVNPTQLSFQKTTVRFRLPATLAAAYNIYIVTVPASAQDTSLVNSNKLLSTRLKFYLRYVHEDGTLKEDAAISTPVDYGGTQTPVPIDDSKPAFVTDAKNVNKMLIAKNFRFPFANYTVSRFQSSTAEMPVTAFLRVETDVTTAAALAEFEKTMRIDCIILEPVCETSSLNNNQQ
ncbi:MAG: fasciclin domain-containing protein [Bacteroidaceae bacterium]|nr:fasciclin domain-containing protein [Bacteroidaceae bacterium]